MRIAGHLDDRWADWPGGLERHHKIRVPKQEEDVNAIISLKGDKK